MGDGRIQDRIQFRLRAVDTDLREAIVGMTSDKVAELARDGLRLILGIRTTKRLEVAERPISVVERSVDRPMKATEEPLIRSKPSFFVPQNKERKV